MVGHKKKFLDNETISDEIFHRKELRRLGFTIVFQFFSNIALIDELYSNLSDHVSTSEASVPSGRGHGKTDPATYHPSRTCG